jgi:hypothetical protein
VLQEAIKNLSEEERASVKAKIAEVERVTAVERWPVIVDDDVPPVTAEQAKLIMVTKMLMAKASAAMTADGVAAKGESFMIALDDVPAWAVEEAIAAWYRGSVPGVDKADFKWAPDSSMLRRIAVDATRHYLDMLGSLRKVLAARHLSEIGA